VNRESSGAVGIDLIRALLFGVETGNGIRRRRPRRRRCIRAGQYIVNLGQIACSERAIAEFQRAITLDPNYAPAHAGLARAYSLVTVVGVMTPTESMPKEGTPLSVRLP
jgi:hypothetical protein